MKPLETLAHRWATAKDEVTRLKRERDGHKCEVVASGDTPEQAAAYSDRRGRDPSRPCRVFVVDPQDSERRIYNESPDNWCAECDAWFSVQHRRLLLHPRVAALQGALLRAARRPVTG